MTKTFTDAQKQSLPHSINDERFDAFMDVLGLLSSTNLKILDIFDVDNVGYTILTHLAEQFDVLGYFGWFLTQTEEQQRNLVKESIKLHKLLGTPAGIKRILAILGFPKCSIIENPCGVYDGGITFKGDEIFTPYYTYSELLEGTFDGYYTYCPERLWGGFILKLDLESTAILNSNQIERMRGFVNYWKNIRSHLLRIVGHFNLTSQAYIGDYLCHEIIKILRYYSPPTIFYNGAPRYTFNGEVYFDCSITYFNSQFLFNYAKKFNGDYRQAIFDGFFKYDAVKGISEICDDYGIPFYDLTQFPIENVTDEYTSSFTVSDINNHVHLTEHLSYGRSSYIRTFYNGEINQQYNNTFNYAQNGKIFTGFQLYFNQNLNELGADTILFNGGHTYINYRAIEIESSTSTQSIESPEAFGTREVSELMSWSWMDNPIVTPVITAQDVASETTSDNLTVTHFTINSNNSESFELIDEISYNCLFNVGGSISDVLLDSLTFRNNLYPDELISDTTIDSPDIYLRLDPITCGQTIDEPSVTQVIYYTPNESTSAELFDIPTILYVFKVTPNESTSAELFDTPISTQVLGATPDESTCDESLDVPTILYVFKVTPDESTCAEPLDTPVVTRILKITPADSTCAEPLDTPTGTYVFKITPADSTCAETLDTPLTEKDSIRTTFGFTTVTSCGKYGIKTDKNEWMDYAAGGDSSADYAYDASHNTLMYLDGSNSYCPNTGHGYYVDVNGTNEKGQIHVDKRYTYGMLFNTPFVICKIQLPTTGVTYAHHGITAKLHSGTSYSAVWINVSYFADLYGFSIAYSGGVIYLSYHYTTKSTPANEWTGTSTQVASFNHTMDTTNEKLIAFIHSSTGTVYYGVINNNTKEITYDTYSIDGQSMTHGWYVGVGNSQANTSGTSFTNVSTYTIT